MGPLCIEAWHRGPSNAVALTVAFYGMMVVVSATIVLVFASARALGARLSHACVAISSVALAAFGVYQLWNGVAAFLF
jgi:hypothetical protein